MLHTIEGMPVCNRGSSAFDMGQLRIRIFEPQFLGGSCETLAVTFTLHLEGLLINYTQA